jgi:hypothetical protein
MIQVKIFLLEMYNMKIELEDYVINIISKQNDISNA